MPTTTTDQASVAEGGNHRAAVSETLVPLWARIGRYFRITLGIAFVAITGGSLAGRGLPLSRGPNSSNNSARRRAGRPRSARRRGAVERGNAPIPSTLDHAQAHVQVRAPAEMKNGHGAEDSLSEIRLQDVRAHHSMAMVARSSPGRSSSSNSACSRAPDPGSPKPTRRTIAQGSRAVERVRELMIIFKIEWLNQVEIMA